MGNSRERRRMRRSMGLSMPIPMPKPDSESSSVAEMPKEAVGRYNSSDKLAIVLACLGVAVAIAILLVGLFLDEPIVLVVLLVLLAACFVYPIQHFARRVPVRIGAFAAVALVTVAIGV